GAIRLAQPPLGPLEGAEDALPARLDERPDQLFLAAEVPVEAALGDPGLLGDVVDADALDAALEEQLLRRVAQPLRPSPAILVTFPAGLAGARLRDVQGFGPFGGAPRALTHGSPHKV